MANVCILHKLKSFSGDSIDSDKMIMAAFSTAPMFLLESSHTNNMFLDCIGNLHFLETDAEVDVVPVRVSEAEPVAAVPLLPHGELLAVLVLAAPPAK